MLRGMYGEEHFNRMEGMNGSECCVHKIMIRRCGALARETCSEVAVSTSVLYLAHLFM